MRVITRHLTWEVLVATAFMVFALTALFAFFDFVRHAHYIGTRYTLLEAVYYVALDLPTRVYEVMPIAVLIGAVYTLSRWAASSEFVILRVCGLSPARLGLMLCVPGLILVLATYGLGELVAPQTYRMRGEMRNASMNSRVSAKGYRSGIWLRDVSRDAAGQPLVTRFVNIADLVSADGRETGAWRVFEFDASAELTRVIQARSGSYGGDGGWSLRRARVSRLPGMAEDDELMMARRVRTSAHRQLRLNSEVRPNLLETLTTKPERMGAIELWRYIDHLKRNDQSIDRHRGAFWRRVFYPLTIFVMLAVARPFAYLNARSGGVSLKIFTGLIIGIAFYALNSIFSFLSLIHTWPAIASALFPSLLVLALAMLVMWWVERR